MTDFDVGDKVEVYDPDESVWLQGVVESAGRTIWTKEGAREEYLTVRTEGTAYGLPMVLAFPVQRTDLIRRQGA